VSRQSGGSRRAFARRIKEGAFDLAAKSPQIQGFAAIRLLGGRAGVSKMRIRGAYGRLLQFANSRHVKASLSLPVMIVGIPVAFSRFLFL
jgi:hypothetical protein